MGANLLVAITNLAKNPITKVVQHYRSRTRINAAGDALEAYVRDLFCGCINSTDEVEKRRLYSRNFSYLGNQNNPPDGIIKNGDAFEIKKIEKERNAIALNSSYPKHKLYSNDPKILSSCINCEDSAWEQKDIIYIIGHVSKTGQLRSLWFVYGDLYAAQKSVYEKIYESVKDAITSQGLELSETKEIARVNKVDPLGITHLRVRGMWGIQNPAVVFGELVNNHSSCHGELTMHALMRKEKYASFPHENKEEFLRLVDSGILSFSEIEVSSPDNPAELLPANLITFSV